MHSSLVTELMLNELSEAWGQPSDIHYFRRCNIVGSCLLCLRRQLLFLLVQTEGRGVRCYAGTKKTVSQKGTDCHKLQSVSLGSQQVLHSHMLPAAAAGTCNQPTPHSTSGHSTAVSLTLLCEPCIYAGYPSCYRSMLAASTISDRLEMEKSHLIDAAASRLTQEELTFCGADTASLACCMQ